MNVTPSESNQVLTRLARGADPYLSDHHIEAAGRVARWFERACLRQKVTMVYEPVQTGGKNTGPRDRNALGDMAIDARKALNRIYEVLPRECAETVIDVCGFEKSLQKVEQERQWPRRSAKLVLRIGLEKLAADLGLAPAATGIARKGLSSWIGEGARPTGFGPVEQN